MQSMGIFGGAKLNALWVINHRKRQYLGFGQEDVIVLPLDFDIVSYSMPCLTCFLTFPENILVFIRFK